MSRLVRRLPLILPEMTLAEVIETTCIHSVAGLTGDHTAFVTTRPFRALHHTLSAIGLIEGAQVPLPGQVSLAHHGMRLLDELPACRRHVLEVLRQPLADKFTSMPSRERPRPRRARCTGSLDARAEACTRPDNPSRRGVCPRLRCTPRRAPPSRQRTHAEPYADSLHFSRLCIASSWTGFGMTRPLHMSLSSR
jgi:hypothetical protein